MKRCFEKEPCPGCESMRILTAMNFYNKHPNWERDSYISTGLFAYHLDAPPGKESHLLKKFKGREHDLRACNVRLIRKRSLSVKKVANNNRKTTNKTK